MASFADGKIEAYLGPTELGAADDLEAVIVEFIGAARSSLDIAVQELDSEPIAEAIFSARWRGVSVRFFFDQEYLRPRLSAKGLPLQSQNTTERRILTALVRADVEVQGQFNPRLFHQKFVLRDFRDGKAAKRSKPALLTGSANFTATEMHANLNHVFVFNAPRVCRQYEAEFAQLQLGRRLHGDVPHLFNLGGVPTKVLFAPEHLPELEIVKQMLKGSKEVCFSIFTFAGSSAIDDTMLSLARGGMAFRGVVDRGQAAQGWAAPRTMSHANIRMHAPTKASGVGKLHHKLMVIDERVVVAGSFNYTQPGFAFNDENIFVLGSVHAETHGIPVADEQTGALARYMKAEIERIIRDLGEPYVP